jgi:hypothetical protein
LSPETFTLMLVCGGAAIALWIIARYTNFGPHTIKGAVLHVAAAIVLLKIVLPPLIDAAGAISIPGAMYLQVFGVALPLLVYAFLSGGWVTRVAIGLLR